MNDFTFREGMKKMADAFQVKPQADLWEGKLKIWWEKLHHVPDAKFNKAIELIIENHEKFPPLVSVLRTLMDLTVEDQRVTEAQRLTEIRKEFEAHPTDAKYAGEALMVCASAAYLSLEDYFKLMADMGSRWPARGWDQEAARCRDKRLLLKASPSNATELARVGELVEKVFTTGGAK